MRSELRVEGCGGFQESAQGLYSLEGDSGLISWKVTLRVKPESIPWKVSLRVKPESIPLKVTLRAKPGVTFKEQPTIDNP